jgi:hypothetical protein
MRQADVWDPPEESTIGGVANRIIREQSRQNHIPNVFVFDAESAQRGRMNAGRTASARARARRAKRS